MRQIMITLLVRVPYSIRCEQPNFKHYWCIFERVVVALFKFYFRFVQSPSEEY